MVLEGEGAAEELGVVGGQPALLCVRGTLHVELDQMEETLPSVDAADLVAEQPIEREADREGEDEGEGDEDVGERQRLRADLECVARAHALRDDLSEDDNQS